MAKIAQVQLQVLGLASLNQIAGWLAVISGAVAAVGVVFFILMMTVHGPFGHLNDICVLLQYLVALPLPLVLHERFKDRSPRLSRFAMICGLTGLVATVVLQYLLVAGLLTFEQQVGAVTFAMLVVVGSWLLITAYLGRAAGLSGSFWAAVPAVLYFGYPIWAFWLARLLLAAPGGQPAEARR